MRQKGTARAASTAAALACLASLVSCLGALDPSLVAGNLCRGGVPDGFLDPADRASGSPAEECDDGNQEDGDGCDQRCRVECTGVQDPRTHHCYVRSGPPASCSTLPGSKLVTIRTDAERDLVASLLAGQTGTFLSAYTVVLAQGTLVTKVTVDEAITSTLYDEPGMLESTTPADAFSCSGCYYGRNPAFWAKDQKKNDVVVLSANGDFGTAHAGAKPADAVCERVPPGDARGCAGSCTSGASSEKRLQPPGASTASTYSYFGARSKIDAAETTCASIGGHLWWIESEEEREMVFRAFASELQQQSFTWVGLRRVDTAFVWSDGVADGAGGRPYFWAGADAPAASPASPNDCAALVSTSGSFATGLLRGLRCDGGLNGGVTISASQPFLCKRSSP